MTPQEVFDYKNKWKPGYTVRLHSDLTSEGKAFCKGQCKQHEWSFTQWTDNYEHTFHFEHAEPAKKFKDAMGRFADQ